MTICKNCGHQFDLDYCNKCGQKASTKRIEMKWLIHDLPHAIWHLDKGFFYNLVQLFKRPGYAIIDYIEGKRKNFYHPVSYLLIILAVQFVVVSYMGLHWYDPKQDAGMPDEVAAFWKEYDKSQQLFLKHYVEFMSCWIPVAALIYWGFMRMLNRKYNYAESLVVTLFITAQTMIIQGFMILIASLVGKTIFTKFADGAGMALSVLLLFFLTYQLGDITLSKKRRVITAIICAMLLLAWSFTMLTIQTEFLHKSA
jgi:hypothetical protein